MCSLAALLLATVALAGCSTEQRGAGEAVDPVGAAHAAPPSESTTPSANGEGWACAPNQVYGFATDPVIYPAGLSLEEVASRLDGETFVVDENTGRIASVTFRNEQGFIVRRLEFRRTASIGWHIERGRAC